MAGPFDLDHFRPKIGKQHGCVRARYRSRKVNDEQIRQLTCWPELAGLLFGSVSSMCTRVARHTATLLLDHRSRQQPLITGRRYLLPK
jgi:hypothetical protein